MRRMKFTMICCTWIMSIAIHCDVRLINFDSYHQYRVIRFQKESVRPRKKGSTVYYHNFVIYNVSMRRLSDDINLRHNE